MDGRTLAAGAVAAVLGYGRAITLARRVMEETPHVLLVGRGAERFAAELGEQPADQRNAEAMRRWEERFAERGLTPDTPVPLRTIARMLTMPVALRDRMPTTMRDDTHGTVNFLALDLHGNMASAVSTSGLAWKYPGRVGDSPLIGAGNYCDNRYGAAACTEKGEMAIRVATARSLIIYLKLGMSLREAGYEALRDLQTISNGPEQFVYIVALTPAGAHMGFTTVPGKQYLYMTAAMDAPALANRTCLDEG
jgi:beta-aspartyl-peptidase (threonine type)